jgi:hypothetical protein
VVQGGWLKAAVAHEMDRWAMAHSKAPLLAALALVSIGAAAFATATKAAPPLRATPTMPDASFRAAQPTEFTTKEEAEAFLVKNLPLATASNPKYRGANGALTEWLTKEVVFGPSGSPNGISVAMKEDIRDFRDGRQTATGTHGVAFLIEDVQISELTDGTEVTENGDKAFGVIFRCNSGKCIDAKWNDVPTPSDWSDISIQDRAMRLNVLAAFQALKRIVGDRSKP